MAAASFVVVNTNGRRLIAECLDSILAQARPPHEVVVVDNCSTDGSPDLVRERFPSVRILPRETNRGFGAASNTGFRATDGELVVAMNEDVTLDPDWHEVVASAFEADPRLGIAGCKLLYPDGVTLQHAGGELSRPLLLAHHRRYREQDDPSEVEPLDVEYVTGAAIAFRRSMLDEIGIFDEAYFAYFDEVDLCQRARDAGWAVRYFPRARAIHHESANYVRDSPRYLELYHHSRVRYALTHSPPATLLNEFIPAERARLPGVQSFAELAGLRRAFADHAALLARPARDGLVPLAPELRPAIADALAALAGLASATTPAQPSGEATDAAHRRLAAASQVEPKGFTSGAPLLGPAIVRLREAWNWMSTRWYVDPMVAQQNAFNAEVVALLEQLAGRLARIEERGELTASWLVELDRDVTALARRVAAGPTPSEPR